MRHRYKASTGRVLSTSRAPGSVQLPGNPEAGQLCMGRGVELLPGIGQDLQVRERRGRHRGGFSTEPLHQRLDAGVVPHHQDALELVGNLGQQREVCPGRCMVKLVGDLQGLGGITFHHDRPGRLLCPHGGGTDDQVRYEALLADPAAHAWRITFSSRIQRTLVIGKGWMVPA